MSLIPYEQLTVDTSLRLEEAKSRLSQALARSDPGRFRGTLSGREFTIRRNIVYANASLPMLNGRFREMPYGTRVDVRMSLDRGTGAFVILWCLFAVCVIAISVVRWIKTGAPDGGMVFGAVMLPFMYLVIMAWWLPEAAKARRFIEQTFPRTALPDKGMNRTRASGGLSTRA